MAKTRSQPTALPRGRCPLISRSFVLSTSCELQTHFELLNCTWYVGVPFKYPFKNLTWISPISSAAILLKLSLSNFRFSFCSKRSEECPSVHFILEFHFDSFDFGNLDDQVQVLLCNNRYRDVIRFFKKDYFFINHINYY